MCPPTNQVENVDQMEMMRDQLVLFVLFDLLLVASGYLFLLDLNDCVCLLNVDVNLSFEQIWSGFDLIENWRYQRSNLGRNLFFLMFLDSEVVL